MKARTITESAERSKNKNGGRLRLAAFLLSFRTSCKAQKIAFNGFFFSGVFSYRRERERATEGKKRSERGQRQRGDATQHGTRGKISAFLGVFSARWYSRQGGTAKGEYKRFFTASRMTASKLGTAATSAQDLGTPSEARQDRGKASRHQTASGAGEETENTHNGNRIKKSPDAHARGNCCIELLRGCKSDVAQSTALFFVP